MGNTITTASSGIVLTAANYATYNPLSITAAGLIDSAIGSAVYSDAAEAWTIRNAGTIASYQAGSTYGGVFLKAGGFVTNSTGGVISGVDYGVYIAGSAGSDAVVTNAGGTITATGSNGVGVFLPSGGTVTNAGTISGAGGTAISFGSAASRVIFDPGAVFDGAVVGNPAYANTLELASSSGVGTLINLTGLFPGFNTVTVDAHVQWDMADGAGDVMTNGISLTNAGTLNGEVYIGGGVVTNQEGGLISHVGLVYGVSVNMVGGTLLNQGLITNSGVYLSDNAYLFNGSTGTITVSSARVKLNGSSTLINAGRIAGSGSYYDAVYASEHGIVTNNGTISASGKSGTGVILKYSGLFTNDGLVAATGSKGYGLVLAGDPWGGYAYAPVAYNNGTITGTGSLSYGVKNLGGDLTNNAAGQISGVHFGVYNEFYYGGQPFATLVNFGKISATSTIAAAKSASVGVYAGTGESVTNEAGGIITAIATGLHEYGATVINAGTIKGSGTAGLGVELTGGTLIDAGTIIGSGGTAVALDGKTTNLLIVDPGAVFLNGSGGPGIVHGLTGTSTLELASGGSAGTLSGFGTQFVNFATVSVDAGASWTLTGTNTLASTTTLKNAGTLTLSQATLADAGSVVNNGTILIDPSSLTIKNLGGAGAVTIGASGTFGITGSASVGETIAFADATGTLQITPGTFAATIDDFYAGDTISLTGVLDATGVTVVNNNTIAVARSGHTTIDLTLDPSHPVTGETFDVVEQGGNAIVTTGDVACFAEGTRIGTPRGPVAVETLLVGDLVTTSAGHVRPLRWIGVRELDLTRHPAPERAQPILIRAGAFDEGVPNRDLRLSPDHAVLQDGMLIPIRLLLNGSTIVSETKCRAVTYYHAELESHDVLLAEQLAAESYLDTGNRSMFANAGLPPRLHPEFANDQARREADSCAPFTTDAARVEPVWHKLAARAAALGRQIPAAPVATSDPALRIIAGDRVVKLLSRHNGRHVFILPRVPGTIRLVSRVAVPSVQCPWFEDRRRLGVMVTRLTLRTDDDVEEIPLDHPGIGGGWWDLEHDRGGTWRWTDGDATLPPGKAGATILEVELAANTLEYPLGQTEAHGSAGAAMLAA